MARLGAQHGSDSSSPPPRSSCTLTGAKHPAGSSLCSGLLQVHLLLLSGGQGGESEGKSAENPNLLKPPQLKTSTEKIPESTIEGTVSSFLFFFNSKFNSLPSNFQVTFVLPPLYFCWLVISCVKGRGELMAKDLEASKGFSVTLLRLLQITCFLSIFQMHYNHNTDFSTAVQVMNLDDCPCQD